MHMYRHVMHDNLFNFKKWGELNALECNWILMNTFLLYSFSHKQSNKKVTNETNASVSPCNAWEFV